MSGYGWSSTLADEVADGGTVSFAAHGVEDPTNDLEDYEVAVGNEVAEKDKAPCTFDTSAKTVTVTNNTGRAWPATTELYVAVEGKTAGDAAEGLDERITEIETRTTAAEGQIADLTTRVEALENAAPAGGT